MSKWILPSKVQYDERTKDVYDMSIRFAAITSSVIQAESDLTEALDMLERTRKDSGITGRQREAIAQFLTKFRSQIK